MRDRKRRERGRCREEKEEKRRRVVGMAGRRKWRKVKQRRDGTKGK